MGARTRGIANQILSGGLDATDGLSGAVPSSNITNASVTSVSSTPSIGGGFDKVASDPPSPTEGDIWYNTTSNIVKGYVFSTTPASWASGGSLNTARSNGGGAGTASAALAMGGVSPVSGSVGWEASEEYNGTSWTEGNNLNTRRYGLIGVGTQTAALTAGGYTADTDYTAVAEEYNGTSWTSVTSLPENKDSGTGTGTQTAGLITGGYNGTAFGFATLLYDGSSWTSAPTYPNTTVGNQYASLGGIQTSAVLACGNNINSPAPGYNSGTISFDGTSWTAVPATINQTGMTRSAWGLDDSNITMAGGQDTDFNAISSVETYDGTSWTSSPASLPTAKRQVTNLRGTASPSTAGLVFGGRTAPGADTGSTDEWTGAVAAAQVKTLTSS